MATLQPRRPLRDVAYAESQRLASDPNIVSVGVGLKLVGGKPTMAASLHYYVWEKLTVADEIRERGSERIQNEVGGYKTDLVQMRSSRRLNCPTNKRPIGQRGEQREVPLVGGTPTSILTRLHNFAMSWGTLGGICFDPGSNASMAISNAHVWDGDIGDDVIQPFPSNWITSVAQSNSSPAVDPAWIAAAASDAEDPTRWGQRTGLIPRPGVKIIRERIHIDAPLLRLPFAGRHWESKVTWGYTRDTTAGSSSVETTEVRPNEHVMVGKRVFTHREVYSPGATVNICAQIWTPAGDKDPGRALSSRIAFQSRVPSMSYSECSIPEQPPAQGGGSRELPHSRGSIYSPWRGFICITRSPSDANVMHKLRLSGPEIIRVEFTPGRSKSYLAGICADKHMIDVRKWKGVSNYYGGSLRLPLREPDGKWAVVVVSQSLDNTPTNGNPITAARKPGGIIDSANITETGECVCEVLFDATFAVETSELL
ncbi:hypothetical protein B0O99DRAFT_738840 [Bisporella sp. PMI_857]|nr:hypothetical protein B0O99DRAFT_738840 [Bisporella sp. PMI_857]